MIAPAWAVLPLALAVIAWAAWYAWRLRQRRGITPTRRRIRTANAVVMILLAGLFAYGLSGVTLAHPRLFVGVWTGVVALTLVMAALGAYDVLHTATLTVKAASQLRRELRRGMQTPDRENERTDHPI